MQHIIWAGLLVKYDVGNGLIENLQSVKKSLQTFLDDSSNKSKEKCNKPTFDSRPKLNSYKQDHSIISNENILKI